MFFHFRFNRLKQIQVADRLEITQHFQSIVDEVGDSKLLTNRGFLATLATKVDVRLGNPRSRIEIVVSQPQPGSVLGTLTTF